MWKIVTSVIANSPAFFSGVGATLAVASIAILPLDFLWSLAIDNKSASQTAKELESIDELAKNLLRLDLEYRACVETKDKLSVDFQRIATNNSLGLLQCNSRMRDANLDNGKLEGRIFSLEAQISGILQKGSSTADAGRSSTSSSDAQKQMNCDRNCDPTEAQCKVKLNAELEDINKTVKNLKAENNLLKEKLHLVESPQFTSDPINLKLFSVGPTGMESKYRSKNLIWNDKSSGIIVDARGGTWADIPQAACRLT